MRASKRKPSWGRYFQNINFQNWRKTKWLFICFSFTTNKQIKKFMCRFFFYVFKFSRFIAQPCTSGDADYPVSDTSHLPFPPLPIIWNVTFLTCITMEFHCIPQWCVLSFTSIFSSQLFLCMPCRHSGEWRFSSIPPHSTTVNGHEWTAPRQATPMPSEQEAGWEPELAQAHCCQESNYDASALKPVVYSIYQLSQLWYLHPLKSCWVHTAANFITMGLKKIKSN